jgi:Mrp family chromosome partitioning ATPase
MFAALHPECSHDYLERFQFLRTELMLHRTRVAPALDFRTVAVMSTRKGEGKSFTASNLAATLAACSGQAVLLVDGNPEGAELPLGVDVLKAGLTQALAEPDTWEQSIHSVKDSTLCVMPRGRAPGRPMDFTQLPALLAHMRQQFEWVVLDGASFASSPDAEWLSAVVDGTLLVTQGGTVKFDAFQNSLVKVPEGRLVGVVFNERTQPSPSFRVRLRFSGKWLPTITRA